MGLRRLVAARSGHGSNGMVRLTLIARTRDGLPLAEGLDGEKEQDMYAYKSQAKVRRVAQHWGEHGGTGGAAVRAAAVAATAKVDNQLHLAAQQ